MKANEAPENIYLQQYDEDTLICLNEWNISEEWSNKPLNEKIATNIKYVRADAFIEKALAYLNRKFYFNNLHYAVENNTFNCMEEMFEDFREYMKGE